MPQADAFAGPSRCAPTGRRAGHRSPTCSTAPGTGTCGVVRLAGGRRPRHVRPLGPDPPGYLVTEPYEAPERTFNNAGGDRQFYAFPDRRKVPLVDGVLAQRSWIVVLVERRPPAGPSGGGHARFVAGAVTAALALPHGAVAWHSDGMETARHLVIPALQLHLGCCSCSSGCCGPRRAPAGARSRRRGRRGSRRRCRGSFGPWLTRPRCPSTTPNPAPWAAWSSSRRCSASPPHRGRSPAAGRRRLAGGGAPPVLAHRRPPACPTTTSARCAPTSGR